MSVSNVKLLAPAVMLGSLTEKVNECPLNWGRYVLFVYVWEYKKCPLYGVAGCPLFREFSRIEVDGEMVKTFRIVKGVHYNFRS